MNKHPSVSPSVLPVEFLVYHFTAGPLAASLAWLTSPISQASAHFLVAKTGDVWQLAPLGDRTWHAGGSPGHPSQWMGRDRVNDRSIGIEIENWGPLVPIDPIDLSKGYNPVGMKMKVEQAVTCIRGSSGFWEPYSPDQIQAVLSLTKQLADAFPSLREGDPRDRLTGHEFVDPKRKIDPGPLFPWDLVRAAISDTTPNAPACT